MYKELSKSEIHKLENHLHSILMVLDNAIVPEGPAFEPAGEEKQKKDIFSDNFNHMIAGIGCEFLKICLASMGTSEKVIDLVSYIQGLYNILLTKEDQFLGKRGSRDRNVEIVAEIDGIIQSIYALNGKLTVEATAREECG